MKDMNWPERVAYLENQLADSDRDNQRLREFIEGLPDGDEIESLRSRLAEYKKLLLIARDCLHATSKSTWAAETVLRIDAGLAKEDV